MEELDCFAPRKIGEAANLSRARNDELERLISLIAFQVTL
jgi:hypothetical protein